MRKTPVFTFSFVITPNSSRTGLTPTGTKNSPASPEGQGLEVDKMNRQLAQQHFEAFIGEVLRRMQPADLADIAEALRAPERAALLDATGATGGTLRFEARDVSIRVERDGTCFSEGAAGKTLRMPIAHADGRYHHDDPDRLEAEGKVVFRYVGSNPNGALRDVADWFRQLWAESLGKRYSLDKKEVHTGQTPIKALGATDQHSQVQLYVEGPLVHEFPRTVSRLAEMQSSAYLAQARRDVEHLQQILSLQRRLLDLRAPVRVQRGLARRHVFGEALTWLEPVAAELGPDLDTPGRVALEGQLGRALVLDGQGATFEAVERTGAYSLVMGGGSLRLYRLAAP